MLYFAYRMLPIGSYIILYYIFQIDIINNGTVHNNIDDAYI